ncbi:hypothetical protein ACFL50_02060 [Candidatus Latescibacterota bacterium]
MGKQLTDFYDVAEIALKDEESIKMLAFIRGNHDKIMQILRDTHIEDYGKDEWIKYVPDYIDFLYFHTANL